MVTGALVALISASLLRMAMLRAQAAGRGAQDLQSKRTDGSALDGLIETWNLNNTVCSSPTPDFTCAPASGAPPGNCGCTCTPLAASKLYFVSPVNGQVYPQVSAALVNGVCQLSIVSAP